MDPRQMTICYLFNVHSYYPFVYTYVPKLSLPFSSDHQVFLCARFFNHLSLDLIILLQICFLNGRNHTLGTHQLDKGFVSA